MRNSHSQLFSELPLLRAKHHLANTITEHTFNKLLNPLKTTPTDSNAIDARESTYLYISTSQIPAAGNGLLTAIDIYKDEIIAVFRGEILTNRQATRRAKVHCDQYFISMPDGSILDSKKVNCFAKYANDALGASLPALGIKNNAKIALDENNNVCLVAKRHIKSGEEILCSYGNRYWKKHSCIYS